MTFRRPHLGSLAALILAGLVAGCSFLEPKPDWSRSYVLHPLAEKVAPAPPPDPTLVLAVFPTEVPQFLDRPQIVTRLNASQVNLDEFHRWAEPLGAGVSRTLAQDIALWSDSTHVAAFPLSPGFGQEFEVYVQVLQLDGTTTGEVTLRALWRVTGPGGKPNYTAHETTFTRRAEPGADAAAAYVDTLSILVGDLAREIVRSVPEIRATRNTLRPVAP